MTDPPSSEPGKLVTGVFRLLCGDKNTGTPDFANDIDRITGTHLSVLDRSINDDLEFLSVVGCSHVAKE